MSKTGQTKVEHTSKSSEDHPETSSNSKTGKIFGIIGVIAVIVLILGSIIASVSSKPSNYDQVWDEAMTVGNPDAENYFVIYSDMVCPYCIAFENAIVESEDAFQKYIENNDILVEVRMTDLLYETHGEATKHSRYGAIASYCAKNEGKFWDYYNLAIPTIWNDYFKNNGKMGGEKMASLGKEYWIDLGKQVGLGETFANCVNNEETLDELTENTAKAAKITQGGVPYFKFNKKVINGFDMGGDWNDVLVFFQQGLDNK